MLTLNPFNDCQIIDEFAEVMATCDTFIQASILANAFNNLELKPFKAQPYQKKISKAYERVSKISFYDGPLGVPYKFEDGLIC